LQHPFLALAIPAIGNNFLTEMGFQLAFKGGFRQFLY